MRKTCGRRSAILLCCLVVFATLAVTLPQRQAAAQPFTSCDQAYVAGVAPLAMGEPGYSPDLDRDGDGVACELADGDSMAPAATGTVGTAVHVVIHKSFMETVDDDQCIGGWALATVRRGSSVVLSESSVESTAPRKVAVGQFFRSRMKDGMCEVLYITSAPVMSVFAVQFVGPDGALSATYGPITSQNVTNQPGIQQAVVVHLEFEAQH